MTRKTTAALTTACVGLAATTAAYMMTESKTAKSRTRRLKKDTGRALRQVSDFIGNVSSMIK